MNLVGGDRRPPEQRQSYVGERSLLGCAADPILTLHHTVVGGRTAEGDPISRVVRAHAGEGAAAGNATLEMIDMRWFKVSSGRLVMAAIFVQPGDRVGIRPTIRGGWNFGQLESGTSRAKCEGHPSECASLHKAPPTAERASRSCHVPHLRSNA